MFFCSALHAKTECRQEISVSVNDTWRPYSYLTEGTLKGADIDIIKLIFSKAGFCPKFAIFPSSTRGIIELQSGRVDVLYAATYTKERAVYADFTLPYRNEVMALFNNSRQNTENRSLRQLLDNGLSVVVNPGSYYGDEVAELARKYTRQFVYVPKAERRIRMVVTGKVDLIIADEMTGRYYRTLVFPDALMETGQIVIETPIRFMFKKGRFSHSENGPNKPGNRTKSGRNLGHSF